MDIKILTSITLCEEDLRNCFVIGTHNGIFHSDEVVGVAILCLLHKKKKVRIIRTRDLKILEKCDICVDVGGGDFDHHQEGFNFCRANGKIYASAGLIWKKFGLQLTCKLLPEYYLEILNKGFELHDIPTEVWGDIDREVISLVDDEDNGINVEEHLFSYISSYLPLWFDSNYDEKFMRALKVTISVLRQKIINTMQSCIATLILKERWNDRGTLISFLNGECTFADNILNIPSQTFPWLEAVIELNKLIKYPFLKDNVINFVIFPYPAGGWAAQCVPPSLEKKFDKRIPFPKDWAGKTKNLPKIAGVDGATFCHNGCFFVRAETKEGVIKMCKLAMEEAI